MGYRRGLSKCSRLSVLRDHLSQNLKAALDRSKAVQSSIDPVLLTNTTNSTVSDAQTSLPVSDTPSPTPTAGTKSLIPNWSYEKSSTAAVIIFTTIAVTALLFLIFLSAQKVRPSWARRRAERLHSRSDGDVKNGCKPASGSTRENIMFSSGRPSTSSQTYIVEQRDGSVSRVYREGRTSPHRTFNSMSCLPAQPKRAVASTVRQKSGVAKPVQARKTSIGPGPRQVVVTQSPMNHAVSMRASPGRREASENERGGKEVGSKSSVALPALQRSMSPVGRN